MRHWPAWPQKTNNNYGMVFVFFTCNVQLSLPESPHGTIRALHFGAGLLKIYQHLNLPYLYFWRGQGWAGAKKAAPK